VELGDMVRGVVTVSMHQPRRETRASQDNRRHAHRGDQHDRGRADDDAP
jgi:hypothetical protein